MGKITKYDDKTAQINKFAKVTDSGYSLCVCVCVHARVHACMCV
jgi:hypothetical protein